MSFFKVAVAFAVVALGAAAVLAFPGLSPEVEAGLPTPPVKADRIDKPQPVSRQALAKGCSDSTLSYYTAKCQRTRTRVVNGVRTTRVLPDDHQPQE
jgi:hypothetical protein